MKLQKGPPPTVRALALAKQKAHATRVNTTGVASHVPRPPPTKRQLKHFGKEFVERERVENEALPRTYSTLLDPGTYKPKWAPQTRPGADDFLSIKSVGISA